MGKDGNADKNDKQSESGNDTTSVTENCDYINNIMYALSLYPPIDTSQDEQGGDNGSRENNKPPRYPKHCTHVSRLQTYTGWPHSTPTPYSLASAGFFYTGQHDLVRCHHCGIGLKDFSPVDDPMTEHIIHADNCDFLIDMYGLDILRQHRETMLQAQRLQDLQSDRDQVSRDNKQPPRYPKHCTHASRLQTYTGWPHSTPTPYSLASAGFFYTGKQDQVRCHHCGIGLKEFSPVDDPMTEHIRHADNCDFLIDMYGLDIWKQNRKQRLQDLLSDQNQGLNRQNVSYRRPEFESYNTRLATFDRWPREVSQRPIQLAEAGLYYTGVTDHVRCFACDGGLRNWEEGEDPWIEHCRWFPACPFVRGTKGDEFIALIQTINKEENKEHSEDIQTSGNANITPSSSHLQEHRRTCTVECGISEEEFAEALLQLRASDSILMENARLNRILKCYQCKVNDVNALFLPCAHHRMCMECVIKYDVTLCPVCDWKILEIVKTFLY
ncbi:baculoviral IAP repeat-containing protein 7-like isoform X2 [Mya arenaria]|uniref:baculoviral IAP repeat-containing protein 7-like isoform X2 n=1 Tax=Mya arenaria TaxID=6604 RepID=UPI0022E19E0A|nr:baculoviral IAP repeat-containing protein 7-like isoform X2 [Mya arenaria]